jgi:hypothetical protein
MTDKHASSRVGLALKMVDLYGKCDLSLVPNEPTDEMTAAGAAAGDVSPEVAMLIYKAMVRSDGS